ncbi:MAG: GTPase ObgE [Deltaproteobacteria bacterium]|nr:GTPase ObgE [Deltaproteobacteria bacterium]
MQFIDEAVIVASSGAGGPGSRHFRREKHVPRGGPDGGDGGRGGDVVMVADDRSRTLLDYHFERHYRAGDGAGGQGQKKTGRDGTELRLAVPPGTQVWDAESGQMLADLTAPGQTVALLRGGNGGWGNVHFATATRQAPERANQGQPGQTRTLRLELKLLADVALVGLPNAGKSSLIRAISASRAEVADYPFTTLVPNLGVVRHRGRVFTAADIPGLVEGAAGGAGLGLRFLRHVERCRVLAWLLSPADPIDPVDAITLLRRELAAFDADLCQRPAVVCLSKADLLGADADAAARALSDRLGVPVFAISAAARTGLDRLLDALAAHLDAPAASAQEPFDPLREDLPGSGQPAKKGEHLAPARTAVRRKI